jgi:hypothetical protein
MCLCLCPCENLLTIEDGRVCRQCFLGQHREAPTSTVDIKALTFIEYAVHSAFCGKVPGYEHADLFGSHDRVAQDILAVLKRCAK